jgi:hypothetical protein
MTKDKKYIYPNEVSNLESKIYMIVILIIFGFIGFNYVEFLDWFMVSSIVVEIFVLVILLLMMFLVYDEVSKALSLSHYGNPTLEIMIDDVFIDRKLEGKINIGKHFKVGDIFEIEIENIYTYFVMSRSDLGNEETQKTNVIWNKKIEVLVLKKFQESILEFSFDFSKDNNRKVRTKVLDDRSHYDWKLSVNSYAGKYRFLRTYEIMVKKEKR